jgi:hypothetical protein
MSTATGPRERPITRADLEAKFGEIRQATEPGAGSAKGVGLAVGVAVVVGVVAVAYFFGNRRGRRRRTIVEVKRVR